MMNKAGYTQIEIAQLFYRSVSSISCELHRNRGLHAYRPSQAQRLSEARRCESHKACKITDEVRE
ncbi:MAG: hypothetical protein KZQ60_04420 [Candidatus Thiodiazotropha sp. (ex Lucinoma aequizonata)]|nr:hypothetical protein [Candidatus Thiodiazotropha sp. (ex Lucinoma aequizonata)]MCU7893815.1 hypothetical protein [Candidatus Thiodiazotropha sp. (ex Lucinoma aequizonata)]MCU7899707.1 hypothetical protein [Candidatus Thiodiazotropha sp. (ex Lucinoma aequizonata)]MCU7907755.1 hypothetical protein [Candidatus Thiodiazotropha sp. (ex Lucinoma aequizonata)]MCU7911713.1 hypothetical protein [Candidatus Thiodiazotropha sp. (ex Lucinoma aequizonata)]